MFNVSMNKDIIYSHTSVREPMFLEFDLSKLISNQSIFGKYASVFKTLLTEVRSYSNNVISLARN